MRCVGWRAIFVPILALAMFCGESVSSAGDAPRVHRNQEYGIQARFPLGSIVCTARSGNHPIGFYSWLGGQTDCNAAKPDFLGAMNITAIYNATSEMSPGVFLDCQDGNVPRGSGIDLRGLNLRHMASMSCAVRRGDGSLEIFVATQGGRYAGRDGSPESRAPLIDYHATLKTRPERVQGDLAIFRNFLANVVIRPIVLSGLR